MTFKCHRLSLLLGLFVLGVSLTGAANETDENIANRISQGEKFTVSGKRITYSLTTIEVKRIFCIVATNNTFQKASTCIIFDADSGPAIEEYLTTSLLPLRRFAEDFEGVMLNIDGAQFLKVKYLAEYKHDSRSAVKNLYHIFHAFQK